MVEVFHASMLDWLSEYDGEPFDACVTDPPYHLSSIVKRFGGKNAAPAKVGATGAYARASKGFMGKEWDGGDIAFRPETWRAVYDALKPGAHLVAFSGTRTYHRMAVAIEDAGFEIRDQLAWAYGTGFPKSHDVSKAIDRMNGDDRPVVATEKVRDIRNGHGRSLGEGINAADRSGPEYIDREITTAASAASLEWDGWGTALKPAWEPICLARKPISEKSIAANVLKHGTGAINIDGCRISGTKPQVTQGINSNATSFNVAKQKRISGNPNEGRFPANICHDDSADVLAGFPDVGRSSGGSGEASIKSANQTFTNKGQNGHGGSNFGGLGDSGSAARFFYSAKAGPLDRLGSKHATVKPVELMRWLVRLVTPPGGHILEPFAGSGTTGIAAMAEGLDCSMIELEAEHVADIERKLAHLRGDGAHKLTMKKQDPVESLGGLFAEAK